jgi:hypothetical protein
LGKLLGIEYSEVAKKLLDICDPLAGGACVASCLTILPPLDGQTIISSEGDDSCSQYLWMGVSSEPSLCSQHTPTDGAVPNVKRQVKVRGRLIDHDNFSCSASDSAYSSPGTKTK